MFVLCINATSYLKQPKARDTFIIALILNVVCHENFHILSETTQMVNAVLLEPYVLILLLNVFLVSRA